tara:strand:+ start:862 stop:1251 length:390 start_codon:yes stop_codon:yes gene_type:complete
MNHSLKMNNNDEKSEKILNKNICYDCKTEIKGKPWITLLCDNSFNVYCCSYKCSKYLGKYMGGPYWDKIVNKEDFNEPRPVMPNFKRKDITCNFQRDEILKELEYEEKLDELVERHFDYSTDEFISDDY